LPHAHSKLILPEILLGDCVAFAKQLVRERRRRIHWHVGPRHAAISFMLGA
jgi:hypothetical protein